MTKGRLEAFSDGVLAIILTIMVLELKVPHGGELHDLEPLVPVILAYVLSFVYVGIYWSNHHHMFHASHHIDGKVLWANLHLLFWLSLVPAITAWVGENPHAPWPVVIYGVVLMMAGVAYLFVERALIAVNGRDSELAQAVRHGYKEKLSIVLYAVAVGVAFQRAWIAELLYAAVAVIWFIPDRRIERQLATRPAQE
jgi:uncharacterized membrane protein